jgi:pimeloyl-ACP methyl ester carboxylesterase
VADPSDVAYHPFVGYWALADLIEAAAHAGKPDQARLSRLAGITQPVLITAGDNDTMFPTSNAYVMASHLPDARVRVYPDAGHGFLFQWPVEFAEMVTSFLSEGDERKPA